MGTWHSDPYDRMALGMARSTDLRNWKMLPEEISEEEYQFQCLAHELMYHKKTVSAEK